MTDIVACIIITVWGYLKKIELSEQRDIIKISEKDHELLSPELEDTSFVISVCESWLLSSSKDLT